MLYSCAHRYSTLLPRDNYGQSPCFHHLSPSCTPSLFLASALSCCTVSFANSVLYTLGTAFPRAWLQSSHEYCLSMIRRNCQSVHFLFERGRTAAILISSRNSIKRPLLILTEAVTSSLQNVSPFGIVCLCLVQWGMYSFYT